MSSETTDVLVLGTGIAGCAAALAAARDGASVTLVTRAADASETNTFYAQGGIVGRPPATRRNSSPRTSSARATDSALPRPPCFSRGKARSWWRSS